MPSFRLHILSPLYQIPLRLDPEVSTAHKQYEASIIGSKVRL